MLFQVLFYCWGYPQTVCNPTESYNAHLVSYSLPRQQSKLYMIDLPRLKETWENIPGLVSHCLTVLEVTAVRNDRARHTILVRTMGRGLLLSPDFSSRDSFSVLFFGIVHLLAQMLFIIVYHTCNRRIIIGYRRILSTVAADT